MKQTVEKIKQSGLVYAAPKPATASDSAARVAPANTPPAAGYGHAFSRLPLQRQETPNRTGLPDTLKTGVERLSGHPLDDVKVHYNSARPAQLNALAYAQGTDIHVAPGQEQHLPHEAWHVVQQKQGRVRPTLQLQAQRIPVNDDATLEREADHMGAKASAQSSAKNSIAPLLQRRAPVTSVSVGGVDRIIQRVKVTTSGGVFETLKYEAWGPSRPDVISELGVGAEIELTFDPANAPPGDKVALVQTVKAVKNAKRDDDTDALYKQLAGKEGEPSYLTAIDRQGVSDTSRVANTSPVYGADNKSKEKIGSRLSDNLPDEGNGSNSYGVRNRFSKNKLARLWDKPSSDADWENEVSKHFETTAIVVEGKKAGTYLGSIRWGYKKKMEARKPELDPAVITKVSDGNPSADFLHAAKRWNETTNEENALTPLPIPDDK